MNERHLIYRIIEYGKKVQFFSYLQLKRDLALTEEEDGYVYNTMVHWQDDVNPNHLMSIVRNAYHDKDHHRAGDVNYTSSILALLPTAIFQYNDYLEIVEARKSAQ